MRCRTWIAALLTVLALALPEGAYACAVCFDPRAENRFAFLATAVFLTILPLSLVGSVGLWLRRRARELQGRPAADDDGTDFVDS